MKRKTAKTLGVGFILLVIFLFCAFASLPQPVRAMTVTTNVTVGNDPYFVAVTPNGAYAYVTNSGSNTVSVISTATNTVTATVPVGSSPECVAITPNGAFAYVTNNGFNVKDDWISVISTTTNTVTANVTIGKYPYFGIAPGSVAITPNGATAYVTNSGTNSVSVISTAPKALFSVVDWSIVIIVIVIVVFLIILVFYKRGKKKTQQTQTT